MSVVVRRGLAVVAIIVLWAAGALVFQLTGAQSDTGHHRASGPDPEVAPAASTPPAEHPGRDQELGIQLSAHHDTTATHALEVMDELAAAGASWLRVDVGWATLQPNGPGPFDQWYVELVDDVLAGAEERDLKVILAVWQTPAWASDNGNLYAPPRNNNDFARALSRAAHHWGDEVDAWEIWNEPNFDYFFQGADPVTYTRMLCAAYPAIKEQDQGSPVLFGGLMYNDDKWLGEAYHAGAKDCFDVLATHPYVGPSDAAPDTPSVGAIWRLTHTPAMRAVMDEWGDDGKPIWITELGWSSGTDNMGNAWDRPVTPQQQAQYLTEAVQLIRKEYPYVGTIIWYRDVDGPTKVYQDGFGLLRPNLSPKPAMGAFKAAVRGR